MTEINPAKVPDFTHGVPQSDIPEGGMLGGRVGNDAALIARVDGRLYCIGAECTHYHAPLTEGLIADGTVRCPWHHARFSLTTGEAVAAPAFAPVACYAVTEVDGKVYVQAPLTPKQEGPKTSSKLRVVIVGGGAGGFAAAEMLRREGFGGEVIILSADSEAPYDRPNCSKNFLSGDAPSEWMPLEDETFYRKRAIELRLNARVEKLDVNAKLLTQGDGATTPYDILILATGGEPQRPSIAGFDGLNVFLLRSLKDAEALAEAATSAHVVAVIGASFIGLEAAAALRQRGLDVHVVAPEAIPLGPILGPDIGRWVQGLHEQHGVVFHLKRKVLSYEKGLLRLDQEPPLRADLIVLGTGVKPRVTLAEAAGLLVDNGVVVDDRLRAAQNIYAIGDIARYPDPISGTLVRIEHWVHAQRQGQHVARVILGDDAPFTDAPFFWTAHYDKAVRYSGHAEAFDKTEVEGVLEGDDALVRFRKDGKLLALATLGRDRASLAQEAAFERTRNPGG